MHCSHRAIPPFLPSNSSCFPVFSWNGLIDYFCLPLPPALLCGLSGLLWLQRFSCLLFCRFQGLSGPCLSVCSFSPVSAPALPYPKLVPCHKSFLALPVPVPCRGLRPGPAQLSIRCSLLKCGRSGLTLACSSNYFSDKMYSWQR